jgi:hypothetical protein
VNWALRALDVEIEKLCWCLWSDQFQESFHQDTVSQIVVSIAQFDVV